MYQAVVVDRDYGSVPIDKLEELRQDYRRAGIELRLEHYADEEAIIAGCADADAILGTGNPPITAKVLDSLPRLKVVQRFGIGVNSVDLSSATQNGVLVQYMPGFCVRELAAHAAALILTLLRNVAYYDRGIRGGKWPKATYFLPREPGDLVYGLFGFGGSARPLYEILHGGLGGKVIAYDPYLNGEKLGDCQVELVSFDQLLERSDVISLHAPLTPDTYHIFGSGAFRRMKNDAMIVNISRGELICEQELIEALDAGEIRFAGLDVFEKEPLPPDSPLRAMDNVVLTCHSAFYGEQARKNQMTLALKLVDDALNRGAVQETYVANRDVLQKLRLSQITH